MALYALILHFLIAPTSAGQISGPVWTRGLERPVRPLVAESVQPDTITMQQVLYTRSSLHDYNDANTTTRAHQLHEHTPVSAAVSQQYRQQRATKASAASSGPLSAGPCSSSPLPYSQQQESSIRKIDRNLCFRTAAQVSARAAASTLVTSSRSGIPKCGTLASGTYVTINTVPMERDT
jgi:hypothetical protein